MLPVTVFLRCLLPFGRKHIQPIRCSVSGSSRRVHATSFDLDPIEVNKLPDYSGQFVLFDLPGVTGNFIQFSVFDLFYQFIVMAAIGQWVNFLPDSEAIDAINGEGGPISAVLAQVGVDAIVGSAFLEAIGLQADSHHSETET